MEKKLFWNFDFTFTLHLSFCDSGRVSITTAWLRENVIVLWTIYPVVRRRWLRWRSFSPFNRIIQLPSSSSTKSMLLWTTPTLAKSLPSFAPDPKISR